MKRIMKRITVEENQVQNLKMDFIFEIRNLLLLLWKLRSQTNKRTSKLTCLNMNSDKQADMSGHEIHHLLRTKGQ